MDQTKATRGHTLKINLVHNDYHACLTTQPHTSIPGWWCVSRHGAQREAQPNRVAVTVLPDPLVFAVILSHSLVLFYSKKQQPAPSSLVCIIRDKPKLQYKAGFLLRPNYVCHIKQEHFNRLAQKDSAYTQKNK